MQSFDNNGEIDKDKLIENLGDVDGIDTGSIPSDSDFDFPLTIVVDDYEVVIEENGNVHIEGEEGGNTNTTPGGNTSHGGNTNTGGDNGTGGGNTNTNPGGNTNTGGDNGTGGGNTSGEDNEVGENNGSGDTNTTNEIEIPDAEADGIIEVSELRWENGTASITITKGSGVDSSLSIQYKKSTDSDDKYVTVTGNSETISGLKDGDVVIVRLTDGNDNYGGVKTINIDDGTKPTVEVTQGEVTETSISVSAVATDGESGMPSTITYSYYIKKSSEEEYPNEPKDTNTTGSYTFEGLDDNESYDIKVEVTDNAGNTGSGELKGKKTLITIPNINDDGVINVEGPNWNGDGTGSITITKGDNVDDELDIEYKKEGEDEYTKLEDGEIIEGLQDGDKIYIHITDGDRNSEDKVIEIKDETNPTVEVTLGTATETSISVSAVATDGESGMPSTITYSYYIKKSSEEEYPNEPKDTNTTGNYTFDGLDDNESYDIKVEVTDNAGNTGSGELKGEKTLITIPNINDDDVINVEGPNWNGDGTGSITITKGDNVDDELDIEYKKEGEDEYTKLEDGETIEGLQDGDKIYIHITDGDRNSEDKVIEIKDETNPAVTVTQGAISTNGITVNVNVHDGESGMPETPIYNYYIKKISDADYPAQPTATDTNASHTFSGLIQGESYDIKVEVVDNAGNTGTGTLSSITTDTIPDPGDGQTGSIVWGNINWDTNQGTASVTVSKGSGVSDSLQIQYQVVANSETQPQENLYTTIDNGKMISNLTSGNVVYARLWDGNNVGSPASINIEDSTLPTVIVIPGTATETSIPVTVNATDSESGISSTATYKYYIKKSTDETYQTEPNATEPNSTYTFTNLENNTKYDIKVEVADRAGKTGIGEAKEIQTLITIPDANAEGAINVSEPQWSDGKASVTVTKGENIDESLYIEYKKEGDDEYTRIEDGETIDDLQPGDKIYIHLTDGTRDGADKEITINDTVAPTVQISLSATSTDTNGSITATVTQTDNATGINFAQTKYVYNTTATELGTDDDSVYTGGAFSKTPQEIILNATTAGTYYLHVLSVDNAGNKKEEISEPVTIVFNLPGDVDGLTYKEGDENTGIVATDAAGNEWVWVEVPKSIYTTATSDTDYTNIYNDMKTYTSSYSGSSSYTDTYMSNSGNFTNATAYNNEKNRMLKSVYDSGGFWISRYEIGTTNASQSVAQNTTSVTTPVSKQNAYPIVNKTQPQSQQLVRKINSQANLLFGVQWDLTLKFLEVKGGLSESELKSSSTSWGNYYNVSYTINRGQYSTFGTSTSWTSATNVAKSTSDRWKLTTGAADRNCKMNIYDMAGNVYEYTLEKYSSDGLVRRGGFGGGTGSAASRYGYDSTSDYDDGVGFRAALYGDGTIQGGGSTEPQVGAIEFENLNWNSSYTTASVAVNKTTSDTLDLQYKVNDGQWETVNNGYTITGLKDGDLVTACLYDGSNRGYYATLNVVAPIGTAEYIASNPDKYYGEKVNYQPKNGNTEVGWKIFYADTKNIYLIADNYISATYVPNGKGNTPIIVNGTYKFSMDDMINDYNGYSDIDSLVKPWLSYLYSYPNSMNNNMKQVAYMLDIGVWSTFKDNSKKAEYAIGGPTLDLFCASYNEIYPNNQIQYQPKTYGYQMGWTTEGSYSNLISGLPTDNSLYVINESGRANGMWIASPSAASDFSGYVAHVCYDGTIYGNGYNLDSMGFRPIVCLKSEVKLEMQSDGTYNIN